MENTGTGTKELYHATLSGPNNEVLNSFIHNGIDTERAKGYFQGAGFYLFQNKELAMHHAKNLEDVQGKDDFFLKKQEKVQGTPIIIVVDEPITPECYDIDYEVFGQAFTKFMYDNQDFFDKHAKDLNLFIFKKDATRGRTSAAFHPEKVPENFLKGTYRFAGLANLEAPNTVSPEEGGEVSKFARKLADLSPEMFNKFESEYLHLSPAIKYNCKKKIWPARIEDINGKVLWKRNG